VKNARRYIARPLASLHRCDRCEHRCIASLHRHRWHRCIAASLHRIGIADRCIAAPHRCISIAASHRCTAGIAASLASRIAASHRASLHRRIAASVASLHRCIAASHRDQRIAASLHQARVSLASLCIKRRPLHRSIAASLHRCIAASLHQGIKASASHRCITDHRIAASPEPLHRNAASLHR
jgi:hypothetical protein